MRKFFSHWRDWIIGAVVGCLLGSPIIYGSYLAYAAIQSEVGINTWDSVLGSWRKVVGSTLTLGDGINPPVTAGADILDVQAILYGFNGATYDRIRASLTADALTTGLLNNAPFNFNGATWDRQRSASGDALAATGLLGSAKLLFNGATWDRTRSVGVDTQAATGLPASTLYTFNGATYDRVRDNATATGGAGTGVIATANLNFDGTAYRRQPSTSAGNLTAVTNNNTPLSVPLSTWSVTNTPAVATQATASKAAGGGTVRHVATTVTVCVAANTTAQTPLLFHLRDGATGAGTILRTWVLAATTVALGSSPACADLSGLAMIGTANTAMTIESAAAPVAAAQATVTLTGFSVP